MGLTKCKECGHEISTKAKVCPNCGWKKPVGFLRGITGGFFIVLGVFSILFNPLLALVFLILGVILFKL